MKQLLKLLSLGMLITLASCSTGANESPVEPESSVESIVESSVVEESSSEEKKEETNGALMKKVADSIFDYFGANRENVTYSRIKRAVDPEDTYEEVPATYRGPERQMPGVLIYMAGVISDIEGVDLITKAFDFSGDFELDMSTTETPNWTPMTLGFTLNVNIDKENNKMFIGGKETVIMGSMTVGEPTFFIDINYDYNTNTLGNFKIYMDQGDPTPYYYEVRGTKAYIIGSGTSTEDIEAVVTTFNNYRTALNGLTKVVATGDVLDAAKEAYVKTQKYQNKLFGAKVDSVRIKESA